MHAIWNITQGNTAWVKWLKWKPTSWRSKPGSKTSNLTSGSCHVTSCGWQCSQETLFTGNSKRETWPRNYFPASISEVLILPSSTWRWESSRVVKTLGKTCIRTVFYYYCSIIAIVFFIQDTLSIVSKPADLRVSYREFVRNWAPVENAELSVETLSGLCFIRGVREPSKSEQSTASSKPQISRLWFLLNIIIKRPCA